MKKGSVVLAICVLFAGVLIAGCASIIKGSDQDIPIKSTPKGATVTITDKHGMQVGSGTTPYSAVLDRGDGFFTAARYTVEVSMKGYEPVSVLVKGKVNGWYLAGNFFFGGLIGWFIVDPLTGAMWNLSPDDVGINLAKAASLFDEDGITVVLKEEIPKHLFAMLPLVRVN